MRHLNVYADGYGNWHAEVPRLPGPRGMHDRIDERAAALRTARQAITNELEQRGALGPGYEPQVVLFDIFATHYHFREL